MAERRHYGVYLRINGENEFVGPIFEKKYSIEKYVEYCNKKSSDNCVYNYKSIEFHTGFISAYQKEEKRIAELLKKDIKFCEGCGLKLKDITHDYHKECSEWVNSGSNDCMGKCTCGETLFTDHWFNDDGNRERGRSYCKDCNK